MIEALVFLLVFQLAGTALVVAAAVPIPGPVVGLVLVVAWMVARLPTPTELARTSQVLVAHLSLLFVPAATGIIRHLDRLSAEGWALLVAIVVSTVLALLVSAVTFVLAARGFGAGAEREEIRR